VQVFLQNRDKSENTIIMANFIQEYYTSKGNSNNTTNIKSIVENNYNRTDIANMKKIFSENDAVQQSMMWNFEKIKYDNMLKNKNKKNLKIKYIIDEDNMDIINEVILLFF
jgi:hypothetical protein